MILVRFHLLPLEVPILHCVKLNYTLLEFCLRQRKRKFGYFKNIYLSIYIIHFTEIPAVEFFVRKKPDLLELLNLVRQQEYKI